MVRLPTDIKCCQILRPKSTQKGWNSGTKSSKNYNKAWYTHPQDAQTSQIRCFVLGLNFILLENRFYTDFTWTYSIFTSQNFYTVFHEFYTDFVRSVCGFYWTHAVLFLAGVKYSYLFGKKVNGMVFSKLSNFGKLLSGSKRCPKVSVDAKLLKSSKYFRRCKMFEIFNIFPKM